MKKINLILLGLLFVLTGYSQSVKSYVITSAGSALMGPGGSIYLSIGEPMNTEIQEGDIMISQGFLNVTVAGSVSTDNLLTEIIKAYPNPAGERMIIDLPEMNGTYNYELHDMMGQLIRRDQISESKHEIDFKETLPGTYFLKVTKDKLNSKTLKIVKL